MEVNRQELHSLLVGILSTESDSPHVYFQAPESVKLVYPCILYKLRTMTSDYADDIPYVSTIGYDVTYITRSPVSTVPALLLKEQYMAFDRYYVADNLHHYAYTYTNTLKEVPND